MSIVQSIHATLLNRMQKFHTMSQQQRISFLHQCYTFMGSNFMKALTTIQYNHNKISIIQYRHLYIMKIEKQSFLLMKAKMKLIDNQVNRYFKFNLECNCQELFKRKIQKKASFLCMHVLLMHLVRMFQHDKTKAVKIQKGPDDNLDELGEILLMIK